MVRRPREKYDRREPNQMRWLLLGTREAAEYLGLSDRTVLYDWRQRGWLVPDVIKPNGHCFYMKPTLRRFLSSLQERCYSSADWRRCDMIKRKLGLPCP